MDSYAGDYGRVLIRTNGGAWQTLTGQDFYGPGQAWNQTVLDLSAYANTSVQVAFLFHSDGVDVAAGWYVDEVTLLAGPVVPLVPNVAESFETGWGDWLVEGGGPWELGRPTSGPGSAHQGSNCVATILGGDYPERWYEYSVYPSRLASPAVVVPPASANPRLRFWQYYSLNTGPDYGEIQIKVGTNAWQMLAHYEGNSSGVWTRPSFDLSAYAGQTVRFGFFFSHKNDRQNSSYYTPDTAPGWYLDEVVILASEVAPTITAYPTNQTVLVGNPAYFTVGASGTAPLNYQWRFNGTAILDATNTSYTILAAQTSDAGRYDAVVTNLLGSATSLPSAVLTVLVPPSITTQPQSQTVPVGSDVTLSVTANGTMPLNYQWQSNGTNVPGATAPSLTLLSVQLIQSGTYYSVLVSNAASTIVSSNAWLTVLPTFTNHDVGDVAVAGAYKQSNGVFTVWGDGEDIEDTADAFQFVHQPLIGDGQIVARVLSIQGGDSLAEAGVMMRTGLDAGAQHVLLALNANKSVAFRRRLVANAYAVENRYSGTNSAWLRLMRMGNTFVGHYSTNGVDWEYVWHTTLNLPNQLEVGLAVTAHSYGLVSTGRFDNVSLGGLTPLSGAWSEPGPRIWLGGEPWAYPSLQQLGGFKMLVGGAVGDQFSIRASPDVSAPAESWSLLGTVTNQWGVVDFLDPQALTNRLRFYRAQRVGP
jgi:hypothetical protein